MASKILKDQYKPLIVSLRKGILFFSRMHPGGISPQAKVCVEILCYSDLDEEERLTVSQR